MRSVEEIYAQMRADMEARCGFQPEDSCDLAVRLYAAAAQIQALEMQADWVLDQSFPQTAQGVYLERHAAMRGLTRIDGTRAEGVLRFSVDLAPASDLTIPQGTVCMTAEEVRFETTAAGTLKAGTLWADVPARAVDSGKGGNVPPETIAILTACPVGVTRCTNPKAFSGGSDPEGDESLRSRVLESYQRLPNGANAAWYEKTAMSHTGVVAARAVGRARGIGTVDVYIAAAAGTPSEELLQQVQEDIQEKREIAVDVKVLAPAEKPMDIAMQVAPAAGWRGEEAAAAAEQALTAFFGGQLLGQSVRLAELSSLVFSLESVSNVRITAPEQDVSVQQSELATLGELSVTAWEES